MARNPYKLAQILERMLSVDKDLRYMAVSDLMNDTEKNELILDDDGEKKVCRHLLKLLEDKSSEVQNIVIRCIGHMTTRFNSKEILVFLATSLTEMVPTKNGEIYCTALKTVVTQFSPAKGGDNTTNAVKELFPKLIQLLAQSNEQLAAELMDIVSDLLLRYGPKLAAYHEQSLETIADWIQKGRSMIRKRATQALGSLATCCHQDLFKVAVEKIFQWLSSRPSDSSKLRNYVMAANYVCRSRGNQFSLYLSEILPKLKTIVEETEEEDNREAVLTTLETFLYFCSGNIADHQQQIQDILLKYLAHDPNYCVGDEDEEMDAQDASWEDDEDNQYSDTDDDLSWKVRRACAKALTSEVKYVDNTGQKLLNWMTVVAPKLIDRLRDREDHVQLEIVHALREMCSQVKKFLPEQGEKNVDAYGDLTGFAEANDEQKAVRKQLEELHPKILRGLSKLIEKKQTIARAAVFELLIVMTQALPNRLAAEFVLAAAGAGLEDKNGGSQIKMLVLQFMTAALKTHEPETFLGHVPQMTNMLVKAVEDNFYKIVAEAILVLSRFATVLEKSNEMNPGATAPHINSVYSLLQQLLQKTHADQEVLHRAIYTTGVYLGLLGDHSKEPELLGLVCDIAERTVVDQATVVAALLALKTTAENSRAQQMMTGQLERILGNVATLMEKNAGGQQARSRDSIVDLQNTLLDLAVTIFNTQKVNAESASIGRLVVALPTLLRDSDLQVAHKALQCMNGTLEMGLYDRGYLPALVRLFESHLLCGFTLQTAIQTVTALAKELMRGGTAFETILDELTAPVYDQRELTKTAYKSIAMATAEIAAVSQDRERASKLAQQLVGHLNSSNQNERLFSIQALGELGRAFPAVYEDSSLKPEQLLSQIFSNASDDLRPVAAQALGAIASGNPTRYLPFILSNLDQGGAQLPLLHAVKEVLSSRQLERGQIDKIWSVLVSHADVQEESIRAVVADCIGKLCDDNPDQGLAALQKLLVAESTNVRYTAVSAFKVLVFDAHSIQNKMLAPHLAAIGDAIKDKDMRVRRIGLIVLNALFSKRTQLMRSYVTEVLPAVYDESKVRKELIREVEMGPFKHLVDDGVDIRKAAYECMFTILERCTAEINMEEYVKNLGDGLQDSNHDIKLLTGMILARLCVLAPATLLQNLPRYTEQMKVLLLQKPKANAVRQELEKLDELKRAVIRMVRSMQKIPDSDRLLSDIVNTINFNKELQPLADKIDRDEKDQTTTNSTPMEQ